MLAAQLNPHLQTSTANGTSKHPHSTGEGGGVRWWSHIWDEQDNESNMTIRLRRSYPSLREDAARNVAHYIPPIKLSWDGLVVQFHPQ
jgi:hypothetical protein